MKIAIFTNRKKDANGQVTRLARDKLTEKGFSVLIFDGVKELKECRERIDLVIVVGGDGTILRVCQFCAEGAIPIVGINLGKLGFLAEVESADIDRLVLSLLDGSYSKVHLAMIEATHLGEKYYALNEVYVKSKSEGLLEVEVSVVGKYSSNFYSDGYIVASAPGSTAYALSCGGPLVDNKVNCHILVPINAHSLSARPVIIPSDDEVDLCVKNQTCASLFVDGQYKADVCCDDAPVKITSSKKIVTFLRLERSQNPFEKLENKRG